MKSNLALSSPLRPRHLSLYLCVCLAAALLAMACDDGGGTQDDDTSTTMDTVSGDMGADTTQTTDTTSEDTSESDTSSTDMAGDTGDTSMLECGDPTGMRPPRLSEHAGAFAAGTGTGDLGTLVVFGGSLGIPENCGFPERTYETTTWLYDVGCDQWSTLDATSMPDGRTRHTAVYDSTDNRIIVFAGLGSGGPLDDTWALDMETGEWSEVQTSGGPPPARLNHAAVYDPAGHRMLVFGGNQGSSVVNIVPSNDVWELDLGTDTWTDLTPTNTGPEPRQWVSALWDPDLSRLVIFGGGDDSAFTGDVSYFDDVWAFNDNGAEPIWMALDTNANTRPDGRFWAGWTYDSLNEQYVLFGGHDDGDLGNRNDTWFFDPFAGTWTEHKIGDVWNKPPNGFCDFPPDFATIDPDSPERRNAHVFASGPGGAYAMGGKTDCGVIDDLARLDFETGEWEILTRATAGDVCLRKGGGDTCDGLCL